MYTCTPARGKRCTRGIYTQDNAEVNGVHVESVDTCVKVGGWFVSEERYPKKGVCRKVSQLCADWSLRTG